MNWPIMFHHFHGFSYLPSQGSISLEQLDQCLCWLRANRNLLDYEEYISKLLDNALESLDTTLTFDDALRCQFDLAAPILDKHNVKACFFVYSNAFSDDPDPLEIFRLFRTEGFNEIEDFYAVFFERFDQFFPDALGPIRNHCHEIKFLEKYTYYSVDDRIYRFIRDHFFCRNSYQTFMRGMMTDNGFDEEHAKRRLWMTIDHLSALIESGHSIGAHSFSHPTAIDLLSFDEQFDEYKNNIQHLESELGIRINTMSHPCGKYNEATLAALKQLGILVGFRSNTHVERMNHFLEVPRINHVTLLEWVQA